MSGADGFVPYHMTKNNSNEKKKKKGKEILKNKKNDRKKKEKTKIQSKTYLVQSIINIFK